MKRKGYISIYIFLIGLICILICTFCMSMAVKKYKDIKYEYDYAIMENNNDKSREILLARFSSYIKVNLSSMTNSDYETDYNYSKLIFKKGDSFFIILYPYDSLYNTCEYYNIYVEDNTPSFLQFNSETIPHSGTY